MSPKLGDKFPKEFRQDFSNRHLKVGSVIRLLVPHTDPPKVKRFVIIAVRSDINSIAILFINSQINPAALNSDEVSRCQLPLKADDCSFLDHNSFLDCAWLGEWNLQTVQRHLTNDLGAYLGTLSRQHVQKAISLVKSAKTIERKLKKRYGFL